MLAAAWKSVLGHKSRFVLSICAVALGIAFMVGSLTFTGVIAQTFEAITKGAIPDVDVSVAGLYDSDNLTPPSRDVKTLSEADLEVMRQVEGVESVEGLVRSMSVYPLDAHDRVTAVGNAPGFGFSWLTGPSFGGQPGIVLESGRAPAADGEVCIDPRTFDQLGLGLDGPVRIATQRGIIDVTVVGTAIWGSGGSAGAQYTFFTTAQAQRLFLPEGLTGYQSGWVSVEPGADPAKVASELNKVLPEGWQATDGEVVANQMASSLELGIAFINTFLLIFAAIGLVVAIFLIANTFSTMVAQRGRELALFRALGASRGQVGRAVLFEAFIIGLFGAIVGIVVGTGLVFAISGLMNAIGMDISQTLRFPSATTILAALVVGVCVTIASAWLPARSAARVAPVAAMAGQLERAETSFGRLEAVAVLLTLTGSAALVLGAFVLDRDQVLVVGLGAILVLPGVAGLAALVGRPLVWLLGRAFRAAFGVEGKLADLNTVRQPRRTAATASALMIGLTLVTTLTLLGVSASTSTNKLVRETMRGDFEISSVTFDDLPPGLDARVADVPGTAAAVIVRVVPVSNTAGKLLVQRAYAPEHFNRVVAQQMVDGKLFGRKVGEVIISRSFADEQSLGVGDAYPVVNPLTHVPMDLAITGIYESPPGVENWPIDTSLETAAALGDSTSIHSLTILMADGADPAQVKQDLRAAIRDYPMLTVLDKEESAEQQTARIDVLLNLIYALLGLAIIIAVLGIVNTLVLTTIQRTRELGMLRAVGLQRRQLRLMITLESVVIAALGAVLGIALGVCFGAALQRALVGQGLTILVIDWSRLGIFLVLAVVAGVLAAVWPASRASRIPILDAIAHE